MHADISIAANNKIITRDHHLVKRMLATGFPDFNKGDHQRFRAMDLFGTGIFNQNGDLWKYVSLGRVVFLPLLIYPLQHRSLTKPFFGEFVLL